MITSRPLAGFTLPDERGDTAVRILKKLRSRLFVDRAGGSTVFLAGMGRSGTTWAANILNYDASCRVMFEPFDSRHVPEARPFRCVQYMSPGRVDFIREQRATAILHGRIRNKRVDLDNRQTVLRRRVIKDVRCNLMLRWLHGVAPGMVPVLMIRHPLSVVRSWLSLGWGVNREGSDFDVIAAQPELLNDFPAVQDALARIDADDPFERIVFQWGVLHLVPLTQFESGELTVVFYEDLVRDPKTHFESLFAVLRRSCDWARLSPLLARPSRTNFLQQDVAARDQLVNGWKQAFTTAQIRRANDILALFGLAEMYEQGLPAGRFAAGKWHR